MAPGANNSVWQGITRLTHHCGINSQGILFLLTPCCKVGPVCLRRRFPTSFTTVGTLLVLPSLM